MDHKSLLNETLSLVVNDALPLVTDPAEVHIARICSDLEHWSAPVELSLGSHCFRLPLPAFTRYMNIGEVAANGMAIGDFDLRSNGDREIIRQINGNVADRSFKRGIVADGAAIRRE